MVQPKTKTGVLFLTLFICIVLASSYGILHDQITYSISPEYFSKFKYRQFHIGPAISYRIGIIIIAIQATWWTGLIIGTFLGLTALIFKNAESMKNALQKAIALVFITTVIFSVLGYFIGSLLLAKSGVNWQFPPDLIDKYHFIVVGTIHNFSYLGGLLGLVSGIMLLTLLRIRERNLTLRKS